MSPLLGSPNPSASLSHPTYSASSFLTQGKRCSGQSTGAGELGDLESSPHKRPRVQSLGLPLAQQSHPAPVPRTPQCQATSAPRLPRGRTPVLKRMSVLQAAVGLATCPDAESTARAAGAVASKAAEEVTTTRLAKGTVASARSAPSSTPGSCFSIDASVNSRSPNPHVLPSPMQAFQSIGLIEFLELDNRPTLAVYLPAPPESPSASCLQILYANPAMRAVAGLLDAMTKIPTDDTEMAVHLSQFVAWAMASPGEGHNAVGITGMSPLFGFSGFRWSASTLRSRFRVIHGQRMAENVCTKSPTVESKNAAVPGPLHFARESISILDLPAPFASLPEEPRETLPQESAPDEPSCCGEAIVPTCPPFEDNKLRTDPFALEILNSRISHVESASFDWTRIPITKDMPAHFRFAREVDWASTMLGPIEEWSEDLRSFSNLTMASPCPAVMYWGPEFIAIYNEPYLTLAGTKHPSCMGKRFQDGWPELWEYLEPAFWDAYQSGVSTMKTDDRIFVERQGLLQEAWFSWSLIPLVGPEGKIVGIYNPLVEETRRKVTERRMLAFRYIDRCIRTARDLKSFWAQICKGFRFNEVDVPFALVYSANEENRGEVSSTKSGSIMSYPIPKVALEATIGIKKNHPAAVPYLDLATNDEGFAPYMKQSMSSGKPIILSKEAGTFPDTLVEGLDWVGYGEAPHTLIVLAVHPAVGSALVSGFIIFGANPRLPFSKDFDELFVHLLSRQLDTAAASIILFEEEVNRGQRAAKMASLERQELQKLLAIRTQEAEASECRFTRMAEFAPVGMFIADSGGEVTYCNDKWWEISRHPRSEDNIHTWVHSVHEEDQDGLKEVWMKMVAQRTSITHEFRFKHTREENGHTMDSWVLLSAFPERSDDGFGIKSIFGCITDISQQKWAQRVQIQQREEALDVKRQQENFIDVTSHEMRNPLSAIVQCADEISTALVDLRESGDHKNGFTQAVDDCLEAAETIALCAEHQKCIVNDVLVLSKIDSQPLILNPFEVEPVGLLGQLLKMFESELTRHEIKAELSIDKSLVDLCINWVMLDPGRLMQVLVNLMTNAIKSTQACDNRSITLTLGASRDTGVQQPRGLGDYSQDYGMHFFPRRREQRGDLMSEPGWGAGEPINLHFSIKDTGQGLGEEEMTSLFERVLQVTPRTHVRYGGSGLGLFISRILIELQGGQIAATSHPGKGSTFAFYIKSRKTSTPPNKMTARKHIIDNIGTPWPEDVMTFLANNTMSTTVVADKPPASAKLDAMTRSNSAHDSKLAEGKQAVSVSRPTASFSLSSSSGAAQPADRGASSSPHAIARDILIVEDNLVNQKVLQKQLRKAGHNAKVANHGAEALQIIMCSKFWKDTPVHSRGQPTTTPSLSSSTRERGNEVPHPLERPVRVRPAAAARSSSPGQHSWSSTRRDLSRNRDSSPSRPNISIILMDFEMPVMDGLTCSRKIREFEAEGKITTHIPIIAATAYARQEQIEEARAAGIDDIISKPFLIRDLMPKIDENVKKWATGRSE